ncbi:MAG: hypothetical protein LBN36_00165, partial [Clostridiales Family XIII bacterium]|nr:hypothetical protein [Clostridiales Family XIII bacterium]
MKGLLHKDQSAWRARFMKTALALVLTLVTVLGTAVPSVAWAQDTDTPIPAAETVGSDTETVSAAGETDDSAPVDETDETTAADETDETTAETGAQQEETPIDALGTGVPMIPGTNVAAPVITFVYEIAICLNDGTEFSYRYSYHP